MLYAGRHTDLVTAAADELDDSTTLTAVSSADAALDRIDGSVDCLVADAGGPAGEGTDLLAAAREERPSLAGVLLADGDGTPSAPDDGPTDFARVDDGAGALARRIRHVVAARRERASVPEELLLETIVQRANDAVLVVTAENRIRFANRAAEDVFGRDPEELEGAPVTTLIPPAYRQANDEGFRRYVENEPPEGEWQDVACTALHADGHEVPVSLSVHEVVHEGDRRFVAILRDVTERRRQKRELKRQRDELAALNRITAVIRDVAQGLVEASSRGEIEATVCERLAGDGPYAFAWVGGANLAEDTVEPRVDAGDYEGYLTAVSDTDNGSICGEGPAGTALDTEEVTVVQDVATDEGFERWRDPALARGFRSLVAVPLVYERTVYGVVVVYSTEPDGFDDRDRDVLAELGRTIGHAIAAVERKQALVTDERVELEFRLVDDDHFPTAVSAETGASLRLEGVTLASDDTPLAYVAASGVDAETIREAAADADTAKDVKLIDDDGDELLFEFATATDTVIAVLAEYGATTESMVVEDGEGRIVADVSAGADIRAVVDALEAEFPGIELVAQRTKRRAVETERQYRKHLLDRLTDRQRTALETAYQSGYFEWPRDRTAEEVADSLGIASPTFHNHLRIAQDKLLRFLFEDDDD